MTILWATVDGCPVPRKLAKIIRPSLKATGATLESAYRGPGFIPRRILHKHGKHTQAELYEGYIKHRPGFLPANRPGTSSHELRSDGVAYPGPVGRKLDWWQCGLDIDDAHVDIFMRHMAKRGHLLKRPYHSGSEYHHVNLKRA